MTKANRGEILEYLMHTIQDLSADWDYANAITSGSLLFTELGMESLDVVVLGTAIQEHYQFQMPFAEFLAELGRERRDVSIAELAAFVDKHLNGVSEPAPAASTTGVTQ